MRHGSLESGIGMFDYAAENMGWDNVFHCEINPFCRKILNYYWPKAKSYANVFGFDGTEWRGNVDVITAGFPCQPFSVAGKREGSKDDRHIWPENMRIFREAKPTFVICENVPGLLTIENGMVFEQVCVDLENEGYEVSTVIIPACATDKDHRRDRIWIIAYNNGYGRLQQRRSIHYSQRDNKEKEQRREQQQDGFRGSNEQLYDNDTDIKNFRHASGKGIDSRGSEQLYKDKQGRKEVRGEYFRCDSDVANTEAIRLCKSGASWTGWTGFKNGNKRENWLEAATRLCRLDDGNTGGLDLETISKSKWRTESLKAYGNTIIWEIAFNIFRSIEETLKIINTP